MSNIIQQVKDFMVACGQSVSGYNEEQVILYDDLVAEEFYEIRNERFHTKNDLKESCDLIWVVIAYCLSNGYDIEGAFNEVARSNMSKLVDGVCVKDANGKVKKGPNYSPANMENYV